MTSQTLQFWLPILVTVFLGLIYVWSVIRKNRPISIQGDVDKKLLKKWLGIRLITKVLRVLLMIATFIVISFSYFPDLYSIFYPFHALDRLDINLLGFIIMLFSVVWMLVAQVKLSRKIVKDRDRQSNSPSNVQEIFTFEENILLGILIMLCGVFISISSLLALIVSLVSLSIYFFYYIFVVVQQDEFLL